MQINDFILCIKAERYMSITKGKVYQIKEIITQPTIKPMYIIKDDKDFKASPLMKAVYGI